MAERRRPAIVAADEGCQQLAVLFLDLDRFKYVNATWGMPLETSSSKAWLSGSKSLRLSELARHSQGLRTELGQLASGRLHRTADWCIAREGGRRDHREASALHRPFKLEEQEYMVTASVGATLFQPTRLTPSASCETPSRRCAPHGTSDVGAITSIRPPCTLVSRGAILDGVRTPPCHRAW